MANEITISPPQILTTAAKLGFPLDNPELVLLDTARKLLEGSFFSHALLDLWNASIRNLRRRIEAYGVDIFESVVKEESGRKKFNAKGETLEERWEGVDDFVLIAGAKKLDVLSGKAAKALEMINWVRNHASAAHGTTDEVQGSDVVAVAMLLQENLFRKPLPDPGHSVAGLFEGLKNTPLDADTLQLHKDQISSLKLQDIRTLFGFMLDLIFKGAEPGYNNAKLLFESVWARAGEDVRKIPGLRYHSCLADPSTDDSADKNAKTRLLEALVIVHGVGYIPEAARAQLYRYSAKALATAKDTNYGWNQEFAVAQQLAQYGAHVPSIAFEDVYQEILAVWFGNFWGRSAACQVLGPFIDGLTSVQIVRIAEMVQSNARVKEELFHTKPGANAKALLTDLRAKLTLAAHQNVIDMAISSIGSF